MTDTHATQPVKSVTLEAVITRADGTVEPARTLAYWHRNPLRRLWWRVTHPGEPNGNARHQRR